MNKEIERKFIIDKDFTKHMEILNRQYIVQNYLVTGKEEVRIREKSTNQGTKFTLTVKAGYGLERREEEIQIEQMTYTMLQMKTQNQSINKFRHVGFVNGHKVEIDEYLNDSLQGMFVAEVEFESIADAEKFNVPSWFGEEVTGVDRFMNQSIWKMLNEVKL